MPTFDGQLAAVEDMILAHVEDAVLHKAHQAGEVDLAVLTFEELLQVVVAQRAVLDVDLTDDADLDLRHAGDGDGGKVLRDEREGVLHLLGGEALARQQDAAQTLDPEVYHLVGAPLLVLVGSHLIAQGAEHVAVEDAGACARRASGRVIWKPLSFSRPEKFRLATGICG